MRSVCVIGLGLIGGSVLRAAAAAGYQVFGTAASAADRAAAEADGFTVVSTVDEAVIHAAERDSLIVLAVPLTAAPDVLTVVNRFAAKTRLTDVMSVKGPIAEAVRRYTPEARYVGGHPMAGKADSGWAAGDAKLFEGAAWVVAADEGTDPIVWAEVATLALECGAYVVPAGEGDHDAAVARISHLPHVLAAVLAAVGADGGPMAMALAAGSFADGTRVAGSDPALVKAMCEGNRDALLDAVDDALGRLGAARGSLASTGSLGATLESGYRARRAWEAGREQAPEPLTSVDLTAPEAMELLRSLGILGGRITSLDGMTAVGEYADWPI
ncbi:prephenate dehydrogenase [Allokutzneria albata]|uniref:Prephenate dehydrogenase n=1 Tax=Allokutzneria albata TaxID=211114 RepID=A0A1H0AEI5_ALLAB|nr:prephenate dehydrogenase [Allokutzneria albata]SDN31731.1 prephenate dehydrogenase [Allokutzneria albata]